MEGGSRFITSPPPSPLPPLTCGDLGFNLEHVRPVLLDVACYQGYPVFVTLTNIFRDRGREALFSTAKLALREEENTFAFLHSRSAPSVEVSGTATPFFVVVIFFLSRVFPGLVIRRFLLSCIVVLSFIIIIPVRL